MAGPASRELRPWLQLQKRAGLGDSSRDLTQRGDGLRWLGLSKVGETWERTGHERERLGAWAAEAPSSAFEKSGGGNDWEDFFAGLVHVAPGHHLRATTPAPGCLLTALHSAPQMRAAHKHSSPATRTHTSLLEAHTSQSPPHPLGMGMGARVWGRDPGAAASALAELLPETAVP